MLYVCKVRFTFWKSIINIYNRFLGQFYLFCHFYAHCIWFMSVGDGLFCLVFGILILSLFSSLTRPLTWMNHRNSFEQRWLFRYTKFCYRLLLWPETGDDLQFWLLTAHYTPFCLHHHIPTKIILLWFFLTNFTCFV